MARSVNKVTLIGHLGKDPELKYTPNNVPVASFSVATSERFKDKEGNWQDRTEWHNVVVWRKLAEICAEYLKKGSKIYCEGSLSTSSWEDENKKKHYKTEIVLNDMIMLDSKGSSAAAQAPKDVEVEVEHQNSKDDDLPF